MAPLRRRPTLLIIRTENGPSTERSPLLRMAGQRAGPELFRPGSTAGGWLRRRGGSRGRPLREAGRANAHPRPDRGRPVGDLLDDVVRRVADRYGRPCPGHPGLPVLADLLERVDRDRAGVR